MSDITDRLDHAKLKIKQGDFAGSISQLRQLLGEANPKEFQIELLYLLAVCQRKLNLPKEAIQTLETLKNTDHEYARQYQELGYNYILLGEQQGAINAFRLATNLNPALFASWKELALLLKAANKMEEAQYTLAQYSFFQRLSDELKAVSSLFHEKKYYKAEQLCRSFLQKNPKNIEAMRLLAQLAIKQKIMDDAEFLLESAIVFDEGHYGARLDYTVILLRRQKFEKAYQQVQLLLKQQPNDIQLNIILADSLSGIGKPDESIDIYHKVIELNPANHFLHLSLGHTLKTLGELDESVACYQQAAKCNNNFGDAYWSLANLKTYRFSDSEISSMRDKVADNSLSAIDSIHFCFALGKGLEDRKLYEESFNYYQRGNQLKNQGTGNSKEQLDKRFQSHIEQCTQALFETKNGMGYADASPIFIVGLPRAGSTLLEQILASHSQIDGTMELPNILGMAYKLQGRSRLDEEQRYPRILHEMEQEQFTGLGQKYIEETQFLRGSAPLFIDKMPNNFIHIGLIQLILPNAKIIDARRHPMSCCFSGFKQLFGEGQDFSYGLDEIGRYYRSYIELMNHWDKVLPNRILRVQHEDVVNDLEGQVRRMLDYCDVPFEQNCLEYYNNDRGVRTPSAEQVRQPIYRSGLEQWKNYEAFLDPLKEALGDEILTAIAVE